MTTAQIVELSLIGLLSVPILMAMFHSRFKRARWICDKLGWCMAPSEQGFDGCSANGICPRCGRQVKQDSQGNWY